jgi:hypothetical protein
MTIITSVPMTTYPAGIYDIDFTLEETASSIVVTLTHDSWADGECLQAETFWDGVSLGVVTLSGGTLTNKDGSPRLTPVDTMIYFNKPQGALQGKIRTTALQTITTSLLMEYF